MRKINKRHLKHKVSKQNKKGSVLLEALIGILLFSFAIMGLGLIQTISITNNFENNLRTEATTYMNELVGKMWATPSKLDDFVVDDEEIPETEIRLPQARKTIEVTGNEATIILTWRRPNDNTRASLTVTTRITPNS